MFSRKKAQENAKNQDGEIGVHHAAPRHESILFLRHFLRLFAANSSSAA
jgi:hypothetical protein